MSGNLGAAEAPVELTEVGRQVVELLANLQRPPRSLRLEMGTVTVDIAWDGAVPPPGPAEAASASAAVAAIEVGAGVGAGVGGRAGAGISGVTAAGGITAGPEHLRAPAVGVFYHAPEPGAEPFVTVGSVVRPNQQIGIVEVMKLMIPVEADRAGTITAVLKKDGEAVEFDEPLFVIDTAGE